MGSQPVRAITCLLMGAAVGSLTKAGSLFSTDLMEQRDALPQHVGALRVGSKADDAYKCDYIDGCPDINCRAVPTVPGKCEHYDDYWLADRWQCVYEPNSTCTLSDFTPCQDHVVCTKTAIFACTQAGDCAAHHSSCMTTTILGYDDCD